MQRPAPDATVLPADPYLAALYADSRLDPIRDKVPLVLRADAITDKYTEDETKPTKTEQDAIRDWLALREQAQAHQAEGRGAPPAELVRIRNLVTQAILQLYAGDMTYGAFARRVRELDLEYRARMAGTQAARP